jgi:hypothetical protein
VLSTSALRGMRVTDVLQIEVMSLIDVAWKSRRPRPSTMSAEVEHGEIDRANFSVLAPDLPV